MSRQEGRGERGPRAGQPEFELVAEALRKTAHLKHAERAKALGGISPKTLDRLKAGVKRGQLFQYPDASTLQKLSHVVEGRQDELRLESVRREVEATALPARTPATQQLLHDIIRAAQERLPPEEA